MSEYLCLSLPVQQLIRMGFALCTLGMLALSLPNAHRFFGTARRRGYADDGPLLTPLLSPLGRVLVLSSWIAAACWLLVDHHTVVAAAVCLMWSRFFFISMRWKSLSRGMGAPGFMLYWLSGLTFLLEYTRYYDSTGWLRPLAILAFKLDFAVIMLCAGQYKMFAGYPQNNGMERGMVNPWWGKLGSFYRKRSPDSAVFWFFNHCAYLGEIVAGVLMLYPKTAEAGALFMAASFVFIFVHIRLGFLTQTVITSCLLFCAPGGVVDGLLPHAVVPHQAHAHPGILLVNALLAAVLLAYIVLLPLAKAGQYYNFYAHKRLPDPWQSLCDRWCNFWGIIIWRVFTIDNTNFYVNVYFEDQRSGARRLYSKPQGYDLDSGLRYIHVCEFVCFVSVFTTLKYFPANSQLFQKRLWRYANTLPCPSSSHIIFEWVDIQKSDGQFLDVASREFRLDPVNRELTVVDLRDGSTATDKLRFAELVEGVVVGSYAPDRAADPRQAPGQLSAAGGGPRSSSSEQ